MLDESGLRALWECVGGDPLGFDDLARLRCRVGVAGPPVEVWALDACNLDTRCLTPSHGPTFDSEELPPTRSPTRRPGQCPGLGTPQPIPGDLLPGSAGGVEDVGEFCGVLARVMGVRQVHQTQCVLDLPLARLDPLAAGAPHPVASQVDS